jgi:acetolactate synthase I/II/III large subunit
VTLTTVDPSTGLALATYEETPLEAIDALLDRAGACAGLITWKMDLELGHNTDTKFGNPDFVAYAASFGARGYRIAAASELLPTLQRALAADTVSVIACPVDYSTNLEPTDALGELDESLS